jgi:thymidylate synthase
MLTPLTVDRFEEAYLHVIGHVIEDYDFICSPRGNPCRECLNISFSLTDPIARVPYLAARKTNIVFHFAEALWYLCGRDDLDMIGHYAPRMRTFSSDGLTLGGSAYGKRIHRKLGNLEMPALEVALDGILKDPDTRRSVLNFFDSAEIVDTSNKNVACVVALQFILRNGKLHAVCFMRANDADFGLLSDVFSLTFIQEFAARRLGVEVGTYAHHVSSMHIYESGVNRVRRVLAEAADPAVVRPDFRFPAMPKTASWEDIKEVQRHEELLRMNSVQYGWHDIAELPLDGYWKQIILLFECYRQIIFKEQEEPISADCLEALDPGFRWLLGKRWPSRVPGASGL